MVSPEPASFGAARQDIKQVPADANVRAAIRRRAEELGPSLDRRRPLAREEIERYSRAILQKLSLPEAFLGFTMVAVSNAFWRSQFESVPFRRRLLLLPNCLRNRSACRGRFDAVGLQCAHCGACVICSLKARAEELGYTVIVAEGTPAVILKIMEGEADGVFGVACLDSLEQAFRHIVELGLPHVAVPLLRNGCIDTAVEDDLVMSLLPLERNASAESTHTYVPLLRETVRAFEPDSLERLLEPCVRGNNGRPMDATERIALDWLRAGGKRLRPFVTIAAYAVAAHGSAVLSRDRDVSGLVPVEVKRIAAAVEALHKASLVHDDIEDDDDFRYGAETLHRRYGVGPALNVGDYLVGLGYRLIAGEADLLGPEAVADILRNLSSAHLELCRGQGAELMWKRRGRPLGPRDALAIYALKTAPAFETALFAGLRAAAADIPAATMRRFSTFLGEGYQVLNDLADWHDDDRNKVTLGQDVLAGRPTVLRAFAIEAGGEQRLRDLSSSQTDRSRLVADVKALYSELGVFDKAERLLDKLRSRAGQAAAEIPQPALRDLLQFLVKIVL